MNNIKEVIEKELNNIFLDLKNFRKKIHSNPELSYEEFETTKTIKEYLLEDNIEFNNFEDLTGGYAYIDCGKETTIGYRADIDALPILEKTNADFKSKNDGLMHACGHDIHTTVALGVAKMLNTLKEDLNHNIIVIFQPAEESNPQGGARLVVEQGIFEKYNITEIYGLHVWPEYDVNEIAIKEGPLMGSSDRFSITVLGENAHAAEPHNGIDAISISVDIINAIEHKLRREIDPFEAALVSIGDIHSEGRYNVVSANVEIGGTIRTISEETREYVHKRINEIVTNIADAYHGDAIVNINDGYPVLSNDAELTKIFVKNAEEILGEDNVITNINPSLVGEDFGFFSKLAPSLFFFLGCGGEYPLHSNKFLPKEDTIYTGVELVCNHILTR